MDSFEPLINVLTLLTVLSVLAERMTNLLKLRHENLRTLKITEVEERRREYGIAWRNILVGILFSILLKADLFAIMSRLEAPWDTLGWVQVENYRWMRSPASATLGGAIYALAGCTFTGFALGFGSKFWHDILGAVYELRDTARRNKPGFMTSLTASPAPQATEVPDANR